MDPPRKKNLHENGDEEKKGEEKKKEDMLKKEVEVEEAQRSAGVSLCPARRSSVGHSVALDLLVPHWRIEPRETQPEQLLCVRR